MASAEAQIQIAVKNLNALNKLDKQLSKINKTTEALLRGLEKLTVSVDNLSKTQGFDNLAKGANAAAKSVDGATKSISTLQKIQEVVGMKGRLNKFGLMGLGGIGATAAGIKGINNLSDAYNKLLGPLGNLLPAIKAPTIALGKFGVVGKAAAVLTSAKLAPALGALAVAYMALGDKAIPAIKGTVQGTVQLGKGLFGLGKTVGTELKTSLIQGSLAFQPLRTEIELTTQALLKLDERFNAPGGVINRLSKGGQMPNRAFGMRQVGTPSEEAARRRNRRINEMAARHREDRLVTTAIAGSTSKRAGQEIKRLKSIDANMKKTAIESKKSNSILSSQSLFGPTAYQPPIPGLGPVTSGTGFTAAQYGPQQLPNTLRSGFQRQRNRLGIGNFANPQGMFASRKGAQGRIGGALTSGMIGGGFPLLFGQSGLASVLGGVGGAVGGALGGGLGFGLSIAGTAMAQKIQETIDYRKAIDDLNVAIKATGGTSIFSAGEVSRFAKQLGMTKEEALQALSAFKAFDASARTALTGVLGSESVFKSLAGLKDYASTLQALPALSEELSLDETKRIVEAMKLNGLKGTELEITNQILQKNKEIMMGKGKAKGGLLNPESWNIFRGIGEFGLNRKEGEFSSTIGGYSMEELATLRTEENFEKWKTIALEKIKLQKEFNKLVEEQALLTKAEDDLARLLDPVRQLVTAADAIGAAFSNSFQGIITGSMSAQQALANFFKQTAASFAQMAAEILAAQIRAKIVGMFANAFASSFNPASAIGPNADISGAALDAGRSYSDMDKIMNGGLNTVIGAEGGYWRGGLKAFARGGMVTRPTIGLVGEAGENEYIIPSSKMQGAMERYSAGARGQAVIPGGGTVASGSGVPGGSVQINYTGPILNFNSEEFVPRSAIPEIVNSAARKGASAGSAQVFSQMRNSRSTRSRMAL